MSKKSVLIWVAGLLVLVVVLGAVLFPCFSKARGKARQTTAKSNLQSRYALSDADPGAAPAPDGAMMKAGPSAGHAYRTTVSAGEALADSEAESLATAPQALDRNAYVSSSYLAGSGQRERLAKLVEEGVMVDGKRVKLEAFASQYSQPFRIPTKTGLSLQAATERSKILTKGRKTYLQVGIRAIDREAPKRAKLNLCLVIDRSGSMSGEKMQYARSAAVEAVGHLSNSDIISVVAYDDRPEVLVAARKASDKEAIRAKIESLNDRGSTDIHSALEAGYAEVRKNFDPKAINEVILLSDGEVTAGIGDISAFSRLTADMFDKGIQTTAIGMGLDYDEELMMTVARQGKGNYHFVREAAAITDIVDQELEDLTHVVASALRLRIELAEGVEAVRVLGSAQLAEDEVASVKRTEEIQDERVRRELGITSDRQDIEDEPGIKTVIPQFHIGDSHVVLIEVKVPAGKGKRKVADVHLKYKDLVFVKNQETKVPVSIDYTSSDDAMVASISRPVKKNVLGFQTGESLQTAAALIERGRPADAAKVIDEQMVLLGVAAREWKDRDLDKDHDLLAAYMDVVSGLHTQYAGDRELGEYLAKSLTYAAYQRTQ